MAARNFEASVKEVLKSEGGWSDHPQDPGGATNHGITLATLRAWQPDADLDDLRTLSLLTVRQIYRAEFWNVLLCDDLPGGVDYMVFDQGVNAGPRRSALQLQHACLMSGHDIDGVVGPRTLAAVRRAGRATLVQDLRKIHEDYYRSLKTFPTFGAGWLARLEARHKHATGLLVA